MARAAPHSELLYGFSVARVNDSTSLHGSLHEIREASHAQCGGLRSLNMRTSKIRSEASRTRGSLSTRTVHSLAPPPPALYQCTPQGGSGAALGGFAAASRGGVAAAGLGRRLGRLDVREVVWDALDVLRVEVLLVDARRVELGQQLLTPLGGALAPVAAAALTTPSPLAARRPGANG
eukprot:scaffold8305_cov51-Phaeocystis_antarctica.AAC.2